jgi:UDP-glucose 4-epimerase
VKAKGFGRHVRAAKCDLTNTEEASKLFKDERLFDHCVFLASNIDVATSIKDPVFDLNANVVGLINFLNAAKIKTLLYMSSTSVYDGLKGPVGPDSRLTPVVPYGISKLAAECYVKFFTKKRGTVTDYIILRLSGAYGAYSPAKKIYNRIIRDFYFDRKSEITLFGDGKNLIDLVSVDEVSRAVKLALGSKKRGYTVDISSGGAMTLNELVKKGGAIFGIRNLKVKHTPFPGTEKYMTYRVLPDGARKMIGFVNNVTYAEGLMALALFYEREGIA